MARVYDAFLGGKDNYEVDREVFGAVDRVAPQMAKLARTQRAWLGRVTRFLTTSGRVEQFLDVGAGLPTSENTHQAAQRLNADARVVYVDNDPVVLAHGRAILEENDRTYLVDADLTRPDDVFAHPTVQRYIDLTQPIALIQSSTIHHVPDSGDPLGIMQRYLELLPSGSFLVLSHFHDPQDDGPGTQLARFVEGIFAGGPMGSGYFRTRAEIAAFFGDLELVPPGITRLRDWWPDGPNLQGSTIEDEVLIGGVGRKA